MLSLSPKFLLICLKNNVPKHTTPHSTLRTLLATLALF